jgi:nucleotide-binding universal stress UspA family protein
MKLDTIVAGVDFGQPSHAGLEWAARHLAPDAEFILVHAMELPVPPNFLGESTPQMIIADQLQQAILDDAEAVRQALPDVRIRTEVPLGRAAAEIAEITRREAADLVLVGPHRERSGIQGLSASTAERVLSMCAVPVLLYAGAPEGRPARILVAVDDSPSREWVFGWARFLAERFGASVTALHCLDRRLFRPPGSRAEEDEVDVREVAVLVEARDWLAGELDRFGIPTTGDSAQVELGAPAKVVTDLSATGFDLVVIGSRGHNVAERVFMGSVASKVIRDAAVPTLLVPGPAS